jgi:hypothetical protein
MREGEPEKTMGGRWLTGCSHVPVELVGGDGQEGEEGSGSQRPPATEILAVVRHADAISSRRVGQLDPELRAVDDRKRRPPWPPPCFVGAGVQQPL